MNIFITRNFIQIMFCENLYFIYELFCHCAELHGCGCYQDVYKKHCVTEFHCILFKIKNIFAASIFHLLT